MVAGDMDGGAACLFVAFYFVHAHLHSHGTISEYCDNPENFIERGIATAARSFHLLNAWKSTLPSPSTSDVPDEFLEGARSKFLQLFEATCNMLIEDAMRRTTAAPSIFASDFEACVRRVEAGRERGKLGAYKAQNDMLVIKIEGSLKTSKDIKRHRKTLKDIKRHRNSSKGFQRHQKTSKDIKRHQKASKDINRHRKTSKDIKRHRKTSKEIKRQTSNQTTLGHPLGPKVLKMQ